MKSWITCTSFQVFLLFHISSNQWNICYFIKKGRMQLQRKGTRKTSFKFLLALQLAICIERKHQSIEEFQDCLGSQDPESPRDEVTALLFPYCYLNAIYFPHCPSYSLLLIWKKYWNYWTGRMMVQFPRTFPLCRRLVKILMGNVTGEIRSESSFVLFNWKTYMILYHQSMTFFHINISIYTYTVFLKKLQICFCE